MKQLFTIYIVLGCFNMSIAQGIQGNVTLSGNASVQVTGHSVTLTWNASQNATSYNVYRGTVQTGPYIRVGSAIFVTTYTDVQVTPNQTFYYVITAVSGSNESGYSNVVAAVIP